MTPRRAIVIDTDPSPDDAVAFLMALGSPEELEVLGLTTVGGNVPLRYTTRNALMALELAGRAEVPVYPGAERPLLRRLETAEHVHGGTGFDGYRLPEPTTRPQRVFAADAIIELVMNRPPRSVTLCALAPLTNIALALIKEPRLAGYLREIVLMGGARREGGNITPAAEYNIFVDPEAAQRVFTAGIPLVMIPLDCTHQAMTTKARLQRLRDSGGPLMEAFYHLLTANKAFDERLRTRDGHVHDGGPLHDPTVISYLLRPSLFTGRKVNVEIECGSPLTRGMTVIDWWGTSGRPANALVLTEIDAEGYFDLVIERLARAYQPLAANTEPAR